MSAEFDHQRRLVAIMFTDIVGFSRLMAEGEARALRILDRHDAILAEQIAAQGGKVLKRMGDSIFASFDSATNAVRCAIAIQQALAAYNNACLGDERLAVRIGVHLGDVIERHGDLFGDGINVAARLQPLAKPGGVCISSAVYQAVLKSVDPKPILVGEVELKNILERHVIYEFPPLYDLAPSESDQSKLPGKQSHVSAIGAVHTEDLPPATSVMIYMLNSVVLGLGATAVGVWLGFVSNAGSRPSDSGLDVVLRGIGLNYSVFWLVLLAVLLIGGLVTCYLIRPASKRYVFADIRGVDEWLEWAVMELGWRAPSKRGKALQFSPNIATFLAWGWWMKLSVWVDGNSVTVVGPAVFVDRLTRTVMATWGSTRR